jgi:gas vesicle protein
MRKITGTNFAIGLIAGALVGAVAGVLAAPKMGIESRQIVGSRAGQVKVQAGDLVTSFRQRVRRSTPVSMEQESNGHVSAIG